MSVWFYDGVVATQISSTAAISATFSVTIADFTQSATATIAQPASATTSGGNMYGWDLYPVPKEAQARKIKYLGPAGNKSSKVKVIKPKRPPLPQHVRAHLTEIGKSNIAAAKVRGAKLRTLQLADDEWLMLH